MSELLIPDVDEAVLRHLRQQAAAHGRTVADEARRILEQALAAQARDAWAQVNALREQLAASGRSFSDSTHLIREDRDR
jgi:plasmid stability protein